MKILIVNPVEESLIDGRSIKGLPGQLKKRLIEFFNEFDRRKEEINTILVLDTEKDNKILSIILKSSVKELEEKFLETISLFKEYSEPKWTWTILSQDVACCTRCPQTQMIFPELKLSRFCSNFYCPSQPKWTKLDSSHKKFMVSIRPRLSKRSRVVRKPKR